MKIEIISGTNLNLVPMEQKIYPFLKNWLYDPDISKFLDDSECNLDLVQLEEVYPINENSILFSIITKKLSELIGICGLQRIDQKEKNAFLRIIIGNKAFWDGKTALESEKLLINFGFNTLKLDYIYSIINPQNIGQIMLVERLGMKKDSILTNYFMKNKKSIDAYKYKIFADEFKI